NTTIISSCIDADCPPGFGLCCSVDPYVRVIQVHAKGTADTVIGKTATIMDMVLLDYSDSPTWTVNLDEGDYLVFELWDHTDQVPEQIFLDRKQARPTLKGGEHTGRSLVGALPTMIPANLEPKK